MSNKVNDILEDLDTSINLNSIHKSTDLKVDKINGETINDIKKDTNLKGVDISTTKHAKIYKLGTLNFDSISYKKKHKNIDLNKKKKNKTKFNFNKKINNIKILNNGYIFNISFFGNLLLFIITIVILGIIDKNIVETKINNGYQKIISIKDNISDTNIIENKINEAKEDFKLGKLLFTPFLIIPNENIKNGKYILKGGIQLTELLEEGLNIYKGTLNFINESGGIENIKITNLISNIQKDFGNFITKLYNTIILYEQIENLPDQKLQTKLDSAKEKLLFVYKFLDMINRDFDVFLNLLGHNNEKKYLLLFQNNDEIRPTGGFIGSLALITLKNGQVTSFEKDDVYAYEWEINKNYLNKIPAPEGLDKITNTFGLRDANYYASFEKSSYTIKTFIDKMNKNIDGIIYINQNTILDFIKETGGIEFPLLEETITEDNFSMIISTLVEAQSFKVGTLSSPKQILFDFINLFINKLKEEKKYSSYFDIIMKNIKSRDIVIYSFNTDENNLLWKLGLNGKMNFSDTIDFNYPFYTSIGGNKSDRYIKYQYSKKIISNNDCSIDTNLEIKKTHYFSKDEEDKVNQLLNRYPIKDKSKRDIMNIQGKGYNSVYTRIILPKDIIVEPKEGLKIQSFDTFTLVEYYQITRKLESTTYNIKYKILNTKCNNYDFKFYKQPGIRKYNLNIVEGDIKNVNKTISGDYIYKNK